MKFDRNRIGHILIQSIFPTTKIDSYLHWSKYVQYVVFQIQIANEDFCIGFNAKHSFYLQTQSII